MALNIVSDILIRARTSGEGDVRRLGAAMKGVEGTALTMRGAFNALKSLGPPLTAAAFLQGIRAAVGYADSIGDVAKRVGLTARSYQELSYAAKQLDLEQGELDTGLTRFSRTLGQARQGSKEARESFARLGLDPRKFKDTDDAFTQVVAKLGQMRDGFQRTALLAQLFGKDAGPKLTEFVTQSAGAIAGLRAEAHALGAVMGDDVIERASDAQKKLDALVHVTKAQLTTALVDLAPILTGIGQTFAWVARQIKGAMDEAKGFADSVSETLAFGINVNDELRARGAQRRRAGDARAAAPGISAQFYAMNPNLKGATIGKAPDAGGGAEIDPVEWQRQQDEITKQLRAFNKEVLAAADAQRDQLDSLLSKYDPVSAQLRQLTADQIVLQEAAAQGDQRAIDALNKMGDAYAEVGSEGEEAATKLSEAFEQAASRIEDAIVDAVVSGKADLNDLFSSLGVDSLRSGVRSGLDTLASSFKSDGSKSGDAGLANAANALSSAAGEQSGAAQEQSLVARLWQAVTSLFQTSTLTTSTTQTTAATALTTAGVSLDIAAGALMSAAGALGASAAVNVVHGGGVMGSDSLAKRTVPMAMFAGAPRFHNGMLANDEYPAILQKGESVLTPAQMRALGGGGGATVTITQNIDARGADPASAANIARTLDSHGRALEAKIVEGLSRGTYGLRVNTA